MLFETAIVLFYRVHLLFLGWKNSISEWNKLIEKILAQDRDAPQEIFSEVRTNLSLFLLHGICFGVFYRGVLFVSTILERIFYFCVLAVMIIKVIT